MSNNFVIEDFIVKAKNIDVDISNTFDKILSDNDKKNLNIYIAILYLFVIVMLWHSTTEIIIIVSIVFFILAFFTMKIIAFEVKWDLKIHNQKIYVYYDLRHHNIDYCDLVNFEIKKIHRHIKRNVYVQIDVLRIYYLKNGTIHKIDLKVNDYIKPEIENICKSFITKKQLDNNPNSYDDYLYTSKDNINEKLDAIEKYSVKTQKYISYIISILIILLIFILLLLIHICITVYKNYII